MEITVNNLNKSYNKKVNALNEVSFKMNGGIFGLIGRNGAGKTTLMRILATVIRQNGGEVSFDGKNIFANLNEYRSMLGYLPQNTRLMPNMHIREFLDYICILKGIKDAQKRKSEVERCVEIVGLQDEGKKKLSKYSGGMLRRAGIAQSLIGSPKMLIIDEPTTGLDPEERLYFINLLSMISADRIILFSTHIIHDIENICENICVLEKGTVMYTGTVRDLVNSIENRIWECVCKPGEENVIKEKATVVSVTYSAGSPIVRYISNVNVFGNSAVVSPSLEDAYINTLGGIKR